MNQPKKPFQIQRMFGLARTPADAEGMPVKDYLEAAAYQVTGGKKTHLSELTFDEANAVIVELGGTAFPLYTRSKRTENYRKQQAGIKTIETDAHLKKIKELADLRGWSDETLANFCMRQIKKAAPTTTEEGNSVVEGLKAMNRREGLLPFRKQSAVSSKRSKEPKFRRVA